MSLLELPIPVNMPVNPELATTFASHGLPRTVITELNGLGLYYLVDATWPGVLFLLSESAQKMVLDLLEKFGSLKVQLDGHQVLGFNLPHVVLQQHSLIEPLKRKLAELTGSSYDAVFGSPTPLALALLPRMKMQKPMHRQLGRLLKRYGLHQQMKLDKVFEYQSPPMLSRNHQTLLALDVFDMAGLPSEVRGWLLDRTSQQPSALTTLAILLTVKATDRPPALVRWFLQHGIPLSAIPADQYKHIITQGNIRD